MKTYEITYLTVNEENHNASAVSQILADNNAKISSVHLWGGRRKLTYPIKKQDQAFYTTVVFEADPSAIKPIEKALSLKDDILRSLVVIYQPGFFERAAATPSDEKTEDKSEARTAAPAKTEEPVAEAKEEVAAPSEEVTEAPAEEAKPKRSRAKKSEEDTKALDDKIDELLNEDLTK